ncbi:hypothetical protein GCM10007881_09020 [Mesorhizobium huakuii]|nr:hypothetical protein GCM10007881_09020 [Mesorhizobium huakuii]
MNLRPFITITTSHVGAAGAFIGVEWAKAPAYRGACWGNALRFQEEICFFEGSEIAIIK